MAEEVSVKKTGAERQAEILVAALERARDNGGVLLNRTQKLMPSVHGKQYRIAPVNALIMAMHSDGGEFKTNCYTTFKQTHERDEAIKKGQKGVPFIWTNNRDKDNPHEDVYTLFNIDQTTMEHMHKEDYTKEVEHSGGAVLIPVAPKSDTELRVNVNNFLLNVKENLVTVRTSTNGLGRYDTGKDTVYIPAQKSYPTYGEYVQDLHRFVVSATAAPQRLNREAEQSHEALVIELASAHKMLELGLPAKLRSETMAILPGIINEIKEKPEMAEAVLRDVNRTVGMIKKAESGQKITPRKGYMPEETAQHAVSQESGVTAAPIMRQWAELKSKHPDAMLLFRTGDFYEIYKSDAERASKILGITLTRSDKYHDDEGKPLQMAGFPFHALDTYLPKLIRSGERVAICDQIENHKQQSIVSQAQEEAKAEVKETVQKAEAKQEQTHRGKHR